MLQQDKINHSATKGLVQSAFGAEYAKRMRQAPLSCQSGGMHSFQKPFPQRRGYHDTSVVV